MNAAGHQIPNNMGADMQGAGEDLRVLLPGYLPKGQGRRRTRRFPRPGLVSKPGRHDRAPPLPS
jgi:hypothetical protein